MLSCGRAARRAEQAQLRSGRGTQARDRPRGGRCALGSPPGRRRWRAAAGGCAGRWELACSATLRPVPPGALGTRARAVPAFSRHLRSGPRSSGNKRRVLGACRALLSPQPLACVPGDPSRRCRLPQEPRTSVTSELAAEGGGRRPPSAAKGHLRRAVEIRAKSWCAILALPKAVVGRGGEGASSKVSCLPLLPRGEAQMEQESRVAVFQLCRASL